MSVRESSTSPAARRFVLPIAGLVCLSALIVFHGALAYFFAQDDFAGLARARGLMAPLVGPWRYLSGQTYFDFMKAVAGLEPLPYRLASLLAHLASAALLVVWLRRRASGPAAWIGATFFATHPALYTALYSVSGIGELLSLSFALAALLLVTRTGLAQWLALPAFALSLLSKESTLLLPLFAAAEWARGTRDGRRSLGAALRDPVCVALGALALAYAAYFAIVVAGNQFGVGGNPEARAAAPYALAFDATLLRNLLTYLGWTVNFLLPTVRSSADVLDSTPSTASLLVIAVWLAGAAWRPLRARGWVWGGLMFVAFLMPVLPLPHHTYHYYLYAPLAGAALGVAALAEVAFSARRSATSRDPRGPASRPRERPAPPTPRPATPSATTWAVAAVAALLLTVNGAALVAKIEHHPFVRPELRADPTVDRALIVQRVRDGLRAAGPPDGARVRFWSPVATAIEIEAGRDTSVESYWERNVRQALLDGLAVRTLFPGLASVEFVRRFEPADDATYYAVYAVDGRLRLVSATELAATLRAHSIPEGTGP